MAGYAQSRCPIDHHMVRQAAAEVLGEEEPTQNRYLCRQRPLRRYLSLWYFLLAIYRQACQCRVSVQ